MFCVGGKDKSSEPVRPQGFVEKWGLILAWERRQRRFRNGEMRQQVLATKSPIGAISQDAMFELFRKGDHVSCQRINLMGQLNRGGLGTSFRASEHLASGNKIEAALGTQPKSFPTGEQTKTKLRWSKLDLPIKIPN